MRLRIQIVIIEPVTEATVFGTSAFIFSIPIGFFGSLFYFAPLLWCILCAGSALIPTAMGVLINSVDKEHRAASSSLNQLICNLGGFFAAPIVSAYIMD